MKSNSFELKGNVVAEPKQIESATFITLGLWGKSEKSTYTDISFFKEGKVAIDKLPIEVGQAVEVSGYISNKKTKEGHTVISLIATTISLIDKKVKEEGEK